MLLPVWALDALVLCCLCVAMLGDAQRGALALNALALLALTTFLGLLCVSADGVAPLSYVVVFTPLFVLEALRTGQALLRLQRHVYEATAAQAYPFVSYFMYALRELAWVAARVAVRR